MRHYLEKLPYVIEFIIIFEECQQGISANM